MPDEKFPETPESKAFALAVERRNAAAAALMLAALSGSMQRKRLVREAADQYLYAMRAELRARAAWLKSGPAPSEPHAPKEPALPPDAPPSASRDSSLLADLHRGAQVKAPLLDAVGAEQSVAGEHGADSIGVAAKAAGAAPLDEVVTLAVDPLRAAANGGERVFLTEELDELARGKNVSEKVLLARQGTAPSPISDASEEADSRTRTGDLRFTNGEAAPSATDQAEGAEACEWVITDAGTRRLLDLEQRQLELEAELAQAKDAAQQGKDRVAALVDYAAQLVNAIRSAKTALEYIARVSYDLDAADRAREAARVLGVQLDVLDGQLVEKVAPAPHARVDYECPVKLPCSTLSHHRISVDPRALEMLHRDGGDGPYCQKCHAQGRPDSMMVRAELRSVQPQVDPLADLEASRG